MKKSKFGELVFSEADLCDQLMSGSDIAAYQGCVVDDTVDIEHVSGCVEQTLQWQRAADQQQDLANFDQQCQQRWYMPEQYQQLDIAEHVLSLCTTQAELQRCGEELLMYKDKDLFDLLKYLKYLVDTMQNNQLIWGVGRGSSVASYVLYKLGVHRIDSMYYDLDPGEFLR